MSILNPLTFYLCPQPEETVFTATVASTPSDPYVSIAYSSGVTGSFGAPLPGQTVEFVGRGKRRLKSYSGGSSGTLGIDESDDVGPIIQAGDSIRIYNQFRLWPKYPRFVQSGAQVTIYADYDEAYTNQTNQWRPTANPGPVGVGYIEGGVATVKFVGDRSQTHAAGATITSYLWTARESNEGTSESQGTEASPVEFTWNSPGWYLVSLKVTDSNGQTHTNYTYVIIIDLASPTDSAFVDFDTFSDSYDYEQGGGTAGFTVRGDASTSNFPEEGLIVHACRGTQTTTTGSWPFREDVLFVGWIMHDTVRQNPDTGEVSFRAATIDSVMKNLSSFPASLTDKTTPVDWTQGKSLTVDRCASFLAKHWSTLDLMTPIVFSGDTRLIRRQDFGPTNLYANLQNNLVGSILGNVVSSHQGVLYIEIDYNVRNTSERAQASTHKTLHKGVWANDVFIEERADYEWPANQVKMSGIYYPGGEIEDICPLFSEAPGDAMKAYGREHNFDRLILASQTDLNIRCGHMLEKLNQRYPQYRESFLNDAAFAIVPQALYPVVIEGDDNDRSLSRSLNVIPRKINRTYNHENGYYQVDVEFEPETSGQPGITVDIPCGPPEQKLPSIPPPPASSADVGTLALMAGTTGTSWYMARGVEQPWERRVQGLINPDQLPFEDTIADPWTAFKHGYNVENIIVWGSGRGFVARSKDSGKNWSDRSSYLEPGPMWPGETGSVANTIMLRLEADIFSEDRLYVLGVWREGGNYRGAVAKTEDGFDFTWHNITGSTQVRPLGMSLDGGNGAKLYVTTWESEPTGTIYVRAYNVSDMSLDGRYALGEASESDIDAQTYYASPFNARGQTDEVYVFGRMQQPQGFTGTVHVLKNTNAGTTGSWSVIENTWGSDSCGAFGVDSDEYFYAVRQQNERLSFSDIETFDTNINPAHRFNSTKLSETQVIVAWGDDGSNDNKACVIDISGDTLTAGASHTFDTNGLNTDEIAVIGLDTTNALVFWKEPTTADLYAIILQVSGSTVSSGTRQLVDSAGGTGIDVCALSATKAFATYYDGSNTVGVVLDVSSTTITVNSKSTIVAADTKTNTKTIDSSSALVIYSSSASINAVVISSITTTFTVNAPTALRSSGTLHVHGQGRGVALLSSTKYAVVYTETDASPDEFYVFAGTITGTTIDTPGSDVLMIASDAPIQGYSSIEAYDDSTILVSYHIFNNQEIFVNYGNVLGTAITLGSGGFISAADMGTDIIDRGSVLVDINASKIVLIYTDTSDNGKSRIITTTNPKFYFGLNILQEKFTFSFGVAPRGMTLDKSLGTVVLGAKDGNAPQIIYSNHPYPTGTATANNFPTDTAITALKWV